MKLPAKGLPEDALFDRLTHFSDGDMPWRAGKTLAYIYDGGPDVERVAKRAYTQYLTENALDPGVYPSLPAMERELVAMAASMLGGDEEVVGNFTTGGTESILLAVKTARDWARQVKNIAEPEIILPVTAHAAFHKGAQYFDVKTVPVPVDPVNFRAVPEAIEKAITPNTAMIAASAPSYAHGVVDPIAEIGAIAQRSGLLFHVDNAIGAFILPYFRRLGRSIPDFDFAVPGVTSISLDLHKYAYCPRGAALILYRDKELRRFQIFAGAEWTGYTLVNPTMQSARTGGPVAAAWAVLNFVGDEGYLAYARRTLSATETITRGIAEIPELRILGTPDANLIAVTSDSFPIFNVIDEMKELGWYVQPQFGFHGSKENMHFSIGQSAAEKAEGFVADLKTAVEKARLIPPSPLVDAAKAELAKRDPAGMADPAQLKMLMEALGFVGGARPKRMADLNQVLNILPPELTKLALTEFFNNLIVQPR
jgi:glutamate/tyrosine decarboxylase-like PLP-dependent enzyme